MKRIAVLALAVLGMSVFSNSFAKDRTLSNGFSIGVNFNFPSETYGFEEGDSEYGVGNGIQLGNRWYFSPGETMGIGLMINWLDVSMVGKEEDGVKWGTIDLTFLEFGPVGTYALSDQMAVDGYYLLRPTLLSTGFVDDVDNTYGAAGVGMTHTLGAAFRWKVLSVGLEYVFGSVDGKVADKNSVTGDDGADITLKNGNTRLVLGVKF